MEDVYNYVYPLNVPKIVVSKLCVLSCRGSGTINGNAIEYLKVAASFTSTDMFTERPKKYGVLKR